MLDFLTLAIESMLIGLGTAYCGAITGSGSAMLLGRFVFREALQSKAKKYKLFRAIDKAVETEVTKAQLLSLL